MEAHSTLTIIPATNFSGTNNFCHNNEGVVRIRRYSVGVREMNSSIAVWGLEGSHIKLKKGDK